MVRDSETSCPHCNGYLKYYDSVQRIIRIRERRTGWVKLRRLRCSDCGSIHRELPEYILPYKQYKKDIVMGVVDGLIDCETLGYEDYPCEMTMNRWTTYYNTLK